MKRRVSRWILRHPGPVVAIALLAGALGLIGSLKLYGNLRPDFEELLPSSARSVVDLRAVREKLAGTDYLAVLVFTRDPALAESFLDKLAHSLEEDVPGRIGRVEWNISPVLQYFKDRSSLFLPLERIQDLRRYVDAREQYQRDIRNPLRLIVEEPEFDFGALRQSLEERAGGIARFPGGYFANSRRTVFALLAYLPQHESKITASYALRRLVDEHIRRVREAEPKFLALDLRFTGGTQDLVEEHASLMHDIALTTAVVLLLVLLVCWFYYGSFQILTLLVASVLIGSFVAFGLAYLIEDHVNANSAFLGSIVLGNGINFGIIFLARVVEELERRKALVHSVLLGIRRTGVATWIAAASAALSYGGLAISDFRGFRQFGMIGFLGMACCWISAYTFLPASLILAGKAGRFSARSWRRRGSSLGVAILYVVRRFPATILSLSVLAALASLAALYASSLRGDLLETNMSRLRDRHSEREGSGFYSRYLHEIFGYPHPIVVLARSRQEAQELSQTLRRRKDQSGSWISEVRSLDDFLPEKMEEKTAILRSIKDKIEKYGWDKLVASERKLARSLVAPVALAPITENSLPAFVKQRFEERDGSLGRMVLVEPPHTGAMEEGKYLRAFVEEVRSTVDAVAPGVPVTGQLAISADLGESISRSGPRVTIFALVAVLCFVTLLFRRWSRVVPVLCTLLAGLAWLFGLTIAAGFKINFVNFIAIPITLGIGVDYAINIYQRYLQERRNSIQNAILHSASAVFLASLTTIIGYGALLLAGNQAIVSFGALATFGEISALIVALFTLPAYLAWREARRERVLAPAPATSPT